MFDEKYQPRSLRENIGNTSSIFKLLNFFKDNIISGILIYGPSNSGKIEIIKGLCHQFFGKYEKTQVLYIRAREKFQGVDLNRKIDDFQYNYFYSKKFTKIIVFDNFEYLSSLSQMSLRERMQNESVKTKFWINGESFCRINQAILSRCLILHLNTIFPQSILTRFVEITNKEKTCISLENLQYTKTGNKSGIISTLNNFLSDPYSLESYLSWKPFFYYRDFLTSTYVDIFTKEERLSLFRKLRFYGSNDLLLIKNLYKNPRKHLYFSFVLMRF